MAMQRTPLLMSRIIDRGATVAPDVEVVTATDQGTRRQTLAETRDRAHALAHALTDAGIRPGDRVGTFMWNGSRHLEAYHATAGMGAVLHTLNIRLSPSDLEYIVGHAQDKLIIADADTLPLFDAFAERIPSVQRVVVAVEDGFEDWSTAAAEAVDYEQFIAGKSNRYTWPELDENAPLGLCYTSGTTGNPKGVEYEHRSQYLHTMAQCMTDSMGLSATDTLLGIVPMFHAMGWGLPWSALMLGCKQVMPHRFMTPGRLVALMAAERVTVSAGVPTIWQGVKAVIEANPDAYDLSALARVTCGGSAPPPSLIRWYHEALGVEMIQGWGMTETSPLATLSRRHMKHKHSTLSLDEQFDNGRQGRTAHAGPRTRHFRRELQPIAARRRGRGRNPGARSVDLFGVLQESAAGPVPRRLAADRRCREDRSGGVPHHRGPLQGLGEEWRGVDFFGRPREPHRRPRRRRAGVRGGAAASEMGRAPRSRWSFWTSARRSTARRS